MHCSRVRSWQDLARELLIIRREFFGFKILFLGILVLKNNSEPLEPSARSLLISSSFVGR